MDNVSHNQMAYLNIFGKVHSDNSVYAFTNCLMRKSNQIMVKLKIIELCMLSVASLYCVC